MFLAAGVASGMICWLGGLLAPEHSLIMRVFPGIVLGVVLAAAGQRVGYAPQRAPLLTMAIVTLGAVGAWRAAVDWGYLHGRPWPMVAAGALGGGVLSATLALAWQWRRRAALPLLIVTLAGAGAAQSVQWSWTLWPQMNESLQVGLLFVGWQAAVALAIACSAPPPPAS